MSLAAGLEWAKSHCVRWWVRRLGMSPGEEVFSGPLPVGMSLAAGLEWA